MIFALVGAVLLTSCSSLFMTSSLGMSDLYRTDNRVAVANRIKAEAEAQRAEAEAREARWAALQAEAEAERAEAEYYASLTEPSYQTIIANDYESAYARRLYGFNSDSYRLPSSYYDLSYNRAMQYATAYDPALYNIMVSGNQVWVEPKFITSMFGSWGATNVSFGIYSSPWNYGWSYRVNPFYYSCWGYPHYSWYDWNWTMCYNPWYYDSCYWLHYHSHYHNHYYPHYNNHYYPHKPSAPRPPQHRPVDRPDTRPNHGFVSTGSGASSGPLAGNLNGGRENSGSRYTSPTSNKNFGATTVTTRPTAGNGAGSDAGRGTVSTGVNTDSKYRGNTTVTVDHGTPASTATGNGATTPATINHGTTTTTTTGNGNSGSGNFRQGNGTTTTTTPATGNRGTATTTTTVNRGTSTSTNRGTTTTTTTTNRGTSTTGNRTTTTTTTTTPRSTTVGTGSSGNRSVGTTTTTTRSFGGGSGGSGGGSGARGGNTSSRR